MKQQTNQTEKPVTLSGANYRRKMFNYYTWLKLTADERADQPSETLANKLLEECLKLPSPDRENAFIDGVLALSSCEQFRRLPKAA